MNGYLVVLRHSMDDIPLKLFENRIEAVKFAGSVTEDSDYHAKRILGIDASTPINVCIYAFADGGQFVGLTVIKDFDDVEVAQGDGEGVPTGPMGP